MSSWYRERHADYPLGSINTTKDEPAPEPEAADAENAEPNPLDQMTKAELLAYAQESGISPANNDMTKAEIRANIDAAESD